VKLVFEVIEKNVYMLEGGPREKPTVFLQYFVKLLQYFFNSIVSFAASLQLYI